ncbi:hypothetical protein MCEGKSE7_01032 [Candidatus Nanopelagicaceae bacterium]
MSAKRSEAWLDFKKTYNEIRKKHPISSVLFLIFAFLYLFGYAYNNLQNNNRLFSSSWFYDSVILSWTNLFIIPILVLAFPWKLKSKDWSDLKLFSKLHIFSPLLWILGYISLELFLKLYSIGLDSISTFLSWLAA